MQLLKVVLPSTGRPKTTPTTGSDVITPYHLPQYNLYTVDNLNDALLLTYKPKWPFYQTDITKMSTWPPISNYEVCHESYLKETKTVK